MNRGTKWSHLLKKSLMENFIFCAVSIIILTRDWFSTFYDFKFFWWFKVGRRKCNLLNIGCIYTAQKMKFSLKDIFSKCESIRRKLTFTFTKNVFNGKLPFACSLKYILAKTGNNIPKP